MPESMTQKELDTIMERLFSIDPKDTAFFRKILSKIAEIDSGARLLRSLNANFNGKKMNLITKAKPGALAHCFDDESEIGVGVSTLLDYYLPHRIPLTIKREVDHGYPKLLFHELTHWEQYQNQGGAENAATDQDRYFAAIMCEADAQVSGDLFKMKLKSPQYMDKGILNPAWQMAKFTGMIIAGIRLSTQKKFIAKTRHGLQESHPDWPVERIEKETRKAFFKKNILDKNSDWRRFYERPENRKQLGILDDNPTFPKKEFPELMKYYMDKYGLTLQDCLDLKKEILAQSGQKFSTHETKLPTSNDRDKPTPTSYRTNAEMLAQTSHSSERSPNTPVATPRTDTKKLDQAILSRFGRGGQGD